MISSFKDSLIKTKFKLNKNFLNFSNNKYIYYKIIFITKNKLFFNFK